MKLLEVKEDVPQCPLAGDATFWEISLPVITRKG